MANRAVPQTYADRVAVELAYRRRRADRERPRYTPYGVAAVLQQSEAPELILAGPAGTGKSRACLEKIHRCMEQYPGARTLILRKTRESLTESGLQTFEDHVLGAGHPLIDGRARNFRQSYRYPNGAQINVGGIDKWQKIMSTEYDLIFCQECTEISETEWEALNTRLRNGKMPYQQLLGDCNPDAPTHWLKKRSESGSLLMLESRHEDNPRLYDVMTGEWTEYGKQYMAKLDALTGVRYQRLRLGKWVGAEGQVYEGWDANIHIIDRKQIPGTMPYGDDVIIPETWRRWRSVDFGFVHPFVTLWFVEDPDGVLYVYRQLYFTQRTVADHAEQIKAHSIGEAIEATVADHAASDRATLRAHNISTTPANKALSVGIQAVQERLKTRPDGRRGLYVVRDCLIERDERLEEAKAPWMVEQEFDSYVWTRTADGSFSKELPVKRHDDGLDSLRYGVMYADNPAGGIQALDDPIIDAITGFTGI